MEILVNAIVSGTERYIVFMGAEVLVPTIPNSITGDKKRTAYAEKEAEKLIKILNS